MLDAPLGDEQNEEGPKVIKLQEIAAQKLGKEDALFVASGTMGNLVALMTHAQPGDSVIMEEESHILRCEVGGLAAVAGLICLENTHNAAEGTCIPPEQMRKVYDLANHFNIKIHIDGARIFNVAVALGVEPS